MDKKVIPISKLIGTLEMPGDKSISHRALILGALCRGEVPIGNLSSGADCASTIACLRFLGVRIEGQSDRSCLVQGGGLDGFKESSTILDAQNSGTTIRLLAGLLAGQPFYSVLTGDDSLRNRPMKRIIDPLTLMGAKISACDGNSRPPITIVGSELKPINYSMPTASAQVKSAILLAGLYCRGETKIIENRPSRDHTERMLKYLGADINVSHGTIALRGGKLVPKEIFVPGDISSAMFFVVAAILSKNGKVKIMNAGLNPTRTGCLNALVEMGAEIKVTRTGMKNEEPFGEIEVSSSRLKAITVESESIPSMVDEIPLLALAATRATGTTIIKGAGELRFKESDRLRNVAVELNRLGASIIEKEDGLEIEGPTPLSCAVVQSYGDHRMAMMLAVAGLIAKGETVIRDVDAVAISFPDFFKKLETLTG